MLLHHRTQWCLCSAVLSTQQYALVDHLNYQSVFITLWVTWIIHYYTFPTNILMISLKQFTPLWQFSDILEQEIMTLWGLSYIEQIHKGTHWHCWTHVLIY